MKASGSSSKVNTPKKAGASVASTNTTQASANTSSKKVEPTPSTLTTPVSDQIEPEVIDLSFSLFSM